MTSPSRKVRFVCISDTHNKAPGEGYNLPKGDVLIHAGDITNQGSLKELQKAADWLQKADFAVKIVIAGNHDFSLDEDYDISNIKRDKLAECRELMASLPGVTYLQHSGAQITIPEKDVSFKVFGSPYSTRHHSRFMGFQHNEGDAAARWATIPSDTDVLITHTPPASIRDASQHWVEGGCPALRAALWRVRPALHICGHCHEGRGAEVLRWSDDESKPVESVRAWEDPGAGTKKQSLLDLTNMKGGGVEEKGRKTAVVNAAIMSKSWTTGARSFNKPIVVDLAF